MRKATPGIMYSFYRRKGSKWGELRTLELDNLKHSSKGKKPWSVKPPSYPLPTLCPLPSVLSIPSSLKMLECPPLCSRRTGHCAWPLCDVYCHFHALNPPTPSCRTEPSYGCQTGMEFTLLLSPLSVPQHQTPIDFLSRCYGSQPHTFFLVRTERSMDLS